MLEGYIANKVANNLFEKDVYKIVKRHALGNILVGYIVNIIIAIVLDVIFTLIPFLISFIVYAQFYLSGKVYIETLKKMKR